MMEVEWVIEDTGAKWYQTRINFAYQALILTEDREDYLFSFNAFISAVGGSLGLFLGFSILSTTFDFIDFMNRVSLRMNRVKKPVT